MKITIDTDARTLEIGNSPHKLDLYSDEAFAVLSQQWLKVGWNQKYSYSFTWLGRPIIQLPEDMMRIQEVIYRLQPSVIVETGIAHGGSLIFYATLCHALGKGRVIGVDIDIRPGNRHALEQHPLISYIRLIEGSSTHPDTVARVKACINPEDSVLVVLDSNHSYQHVMNELNTYAVLVTPASYLVVTDGIMRDLYDVPTGQTSWEADNPARAAEDFVATHSGFVLETPTRLFDESKSHHDVTYWPSAWLIKR